MVVPSPLVNSFTSAAEWADYPKLSPALYLKIGESTLDGWPLELKAQSLTLDKLLRGENKELPIDCDFEAFSNIRNLGRRPDYIALTPKGMATFTFLANCVTALHLGGCLNCTFTQTTGTLKLDPEVKLALQGLLLTGFSQTMGRDFTLIWDWTLEWCRKDVYKKDLLTTATEGKLEQQFNRFKKAFRVAFPDTTLPLKSSLTGDYRIPFRLLCAQGSLHAMVIYDLYLEKESLEHWAHYMDYLIIKGSLVGDWRTVWKC